MIGMKHRGSLDQSGNPFEAFDDEVDKQFCLWAFGYCWTSLFEQHLQVEVIVKVEEELMEVVTDVVCNLEENFYILQVCFWQLQSLYVLDWEQLDVCLDHSFLGGVHKIWPDIEMMEELSNNGFPPEVFCRGMMKGEVMALVRCGKEDST